MTMEVRINGQTECYEGPLALEEILRRKQIDRRFLVVEHNGRAVAREEFTALEICDGDRLELVRPVAGG